MINIAICDDERTDIAYITALVFKWAEIRSIAARLSDYESAESFLFAFEDEKSVDILLLDIQMDGLDGVELARRLRSMDTAVQIVFITGYPEYMAQGYDVSALHYLMKPVKEDKLFEVLDRAAARLAAAPPSILLPLRDGRAAVPADDIVYAEVFSHDVALYTRTETLHLRVSMRELETLLGKGFFRCHRSYIANMKRVRRVTRKALTLESGQELPLSRPLYDAANQVFIKYKREG